MEQLRERVLADPRDPPPVEELLVLWVEHRFDDLAEVLRLVTDLDDRLAVLHAMAAQPSERVVRSILRAVMGQPWPAEGGLTKGAHELVVAAFPEAEADTWAALLLEEA